MGEIISGSFGKKAEQQPISPFEKSGVTKNSFSGESVFSPNGVVEYQSGVRPRDDARVNEKVVVHVVPMEKTIYSIAPTLKGQEIPEEMSELTDQLSYTQLVDAIADSTTEEWAQEPEWYLALIREVQKRDLDVED
jgi:hypothetical protein